jgi:hypothetical protein
MKKVVALQGEDSFLKKSIEDILAVRRILMLPANITARNPAISLPPSAIIIAITDPSAARREIEFGVHLFGAIETYLVSTEQIDASDLPRTPLPAISYIRVNDDLSDLQEAIGHIINSQDWESPAFWNDNNAPTAPRISRKNMELLSARIGVVISGLAELRINSISPFIEELKNIGIFFENIGAPTDDFDQEDANDIATRALTALGNILDVVGSKTTVQMIVAGAITGILGTIGWPAVTAYGLSLAAWQGKDAFMAALKSLPTHRK